MFRPCITLCCIPATLALYGDENARGSVMAASLASIETAIYVISCLAVFFVTVCCFYCCKHFCCDECRGKSVIYEQMEPTALNTGSIRMSSNETNEGISGSENRPYLQVDIPLQGMKKGESGQPSILEEDPQRDV